MPRQRLALFAVCVIALAAIVWVAASAAFDRPRSDGPLSTSSGYAVRATLGPGETFSWSVGLPFNHSDRDAVIRAVDLVGMHDVDVLAIVTTYGLDWPDGSCLAAGATYGFPPTATKPDGTTQEFPRRETVGAIVPSASNRTCASHPSISVGVRRIADTGVGRIESIRVRYEYAGADYEAVLPWSLTVEPKS